MIPVLLLMVSLSGNSGYHWQDTRTACWGISHYTASNSQCSVFCCPIAGKVCCMQVFCHRLLGIPCKKSCCGFLSTSQWFLLSSTCISRCCHAKHQSTSSYLYLDSNSYNNNHHCASITTILTIPQNISWSDSRQMCINENSSWLQPVQNSIVELCSTTIMLNNFVSIPLH